MSRAIYRIGVISDTHGILQPAVFDLFEGVDLILHAGDVGNDDLLVELAAIAPVRAVSGNVDGMPTNERPLARRLSTFVGKIAMTHGHLPDSSAYDPGTLIETFRDFEPMFIIFGHTHLPTIVERDGVTLFNPGTAGRATVGGRGPTVGMITLDEGSCRPRAEHLSLVVRS